MSGTDPWEDPEVVALLTLFAKECRLSGFRVHGPHISKTSDGGQRFRVSIVYGDELYGKRVTVGEMCMHNAGEIYVWERTPGSATRYSTWEEAVEAAERIINEW